MSSRRHLLSSVYSTLFSTCMVLLSVSGTANGVSPRIDEPTVGSGTVDSDLTEVKRLVAPDGKEGDRFGGVVDISGDTVLVGATFEDLGAGAAYVFQRSAGGNNNWGQVKKLRPDDARAGDRFGRGAVHGGTAVVGAFGSAAGGFNSGAAYLFRRNRGGRNNWGQVKKLLPDDSQPDVHFGGSTAISGGTALVGAWGSDTAGFNAGAAYIFRRNAGGGNNWGQVKKLVAEDAQAGAEFGITVAISGGTALIGAFQDAAGGPSAGAAYIFRRNQGGRDNWGQVKKLVASDAQPGDLFGLGVAIDGDTAVVGAFGSDAGSFDAGAAYVFQRHEGGRNNWGQVQKLVADNGRATDNFGVSTAISGDTAIVGAWTADAGGTDSGAAYVFRRHEGGEDSWGQVQELLAGDAQAGDAFGSAVALSGDTAVVGSFLADATAPNSGAAYVFSRAGICDSSQSPMRDHDS